MMKADSVPPYHALMWPTLIALKQMGGSASNEELLGKVVEIEAISEETASQLHSDQRQTKLNYNLAWAKTYLKKVGAIDNSVRGVWSLTDIGERMTPAEVAAVPARVRKMPSARRDGEDRSDGLDADDAGGLEEALKAERSPPEETWKDRLLASLRRLPPDAFERLSQRVLREAGFIRVEVTGRVGDGGIDGQGVLRVALLSFQVLFQCKRYSGTVGASAVRDFRGAMVGRCDKGLIITTGTFSSDAKREATRDGAPAIDLIDGDQLCELLRSLKLGVRTELVETINVDLDWFSKL
ncbi:restriction endonuclease [Salinarimonas rosea]|uniref:restriction endonuclease n=1 Tax=Salinarimonas rosea TaxID=552063 RepID=UPI0005BD265D|nr:restriction endonuclease [Salinarimonas rosea]